MPVTAYRFNFPFLRKKMIYSFNFLLLFNLFTVLTSESKFWLFLYQDWLHFSFILIYLVLPYTPYCFIVKDKKFCNTFLLFGLENCLTWSQWCHNRCPLCCCFWFSKWRQGIESSLKGTVTQKEKLLSVTMRARETESLEWQHSTHPVVELNSKSQKQRSLRTSMLPLHALK